jgi:wobble nucleotide-excising tRNase
MEKLVEGNLQIIAAKIKEPSSVVSLDNEGVKTVREELNALISEFNKLIQTNNNIARDKRNTKKECTTNVWQLIAFTLQTQVADYTKRRKDFDDSISGLQTSISDGDKVSRAFEAEIADLNTRIVSTLPTIKSMNNLQRDSGFQGFYLREKQNIKNTYEVIRQDGSVAKDLSEGERNFIAFLYFYHIVKGSVDGENDLGKDKIVVIDDPVSSMDSSVVFIVGTLVREMIGVCYNNIEYLEEEREVQGDYIKQIFVLTHNVYFHNEVTYNQTRLFQFVSLFLVTKKNNESSIKLCTRQCPTSPTDMENYNPVQNSYAALWSEYKEIDTVIPMMNVIRRIMESYFIQLCGYNGVNIRTRVLRCNKDKFVTSLPDGTVDNEKYQLASSMLSYIAANSVGFSDGLNYVDDCTDVATCKNVFKLIFEALEQEQHYKLMMGEE